MLSKEGKIEKIEKIQQLFKDFLSILGVDLSDKNFRDTPERVARMWVNELMKGYDDVDFKITTFENINYDQIISNVDIPFYSLCQHHAIPFFGVVHIAVVPDKKILGLSKFDRIVIHFSRKLQMQENLTQEIADYLDKMLKPKGCMVIIEARHLCKDMRGARNPGSVMITSVVKGCFKDNPATRNEFLELIRLRRSKVG